VCRPADSGRVVWSGPRWNDRENDRSAPQPPDRIPLGRDRARRRPAAPTSPDATNRLRRRVQRVGPAGDHPSPGGWWLRWTMTVPGRSASPATRKPGCRSSSSTGDARSPATVKTCKQRTLRLAMGRRRREEATRWRRRRRRPGRPRRWPRTAPVLRHRLSGDHPGDVVRRQPLNQRTLVPDVANVVLVAAPGPSCGSRQGVTCDRIGFPGRSSVQPTNGGRRRCARRDRRSTGVRRWLAPQLRSGLGDPAAGEAA
jgi:hypothetical protein